MIIAVSGCSALEFWRRAASREAVLKNRQDFTIRSGKLFMSAGITEKSVKKNDRCRVIQEIAEYLIEEFGLSAPVHFMVSPEMRRDRSESFVCHTLKAELPENSFIDSSSIFPFPLGTSMLHERVLLCVSCPEMTFVQMSGEQDFVKSVLLGYELCGEYIPDKTEHYGMRQAEKATTVRKLTSYIDKLENVPGKRRARRAAAFVLDNSWSPMESKLAVLAVLPMSLGGYGLSKPELNKKVNLSASGMSVLRQGSIYVDALWELQKVAVEYDSDAAHLESRQHDRDKNRSAALVHSGYRLVPITKYDMMYFNTIEKDFIALRKLLGLRKDGPILKKYEDQRRNLVRILKTKY